MRPRFFSFLLFLFAFSLAACDDNPVDGGEDHAEVNGLTLRLNGVEVYRLFQGQVSCAQAPCGITVAQGEETARITTTFLDEDGDAIDADDLEEGLHLDVAFGNAGVAAFEQHAEDGPWSFHIRGEAAGVTRAQVLLMHGDHPDFRTPPLTEPTALTITVTE